MSRENMPVIREIHEGYSGSAREQLEKIQALRDRGVPDNDTLQKIVHEVMEDWNTEETQAAVMNGDVWEHLSLADDDERKEKGVVNGMIMPGGGLACVAQFGVLRALIEQGVLPNIDHLFASPGSAWSAVGALASYGHESEEEIKEWLRIYTSIFTRDLRGDQFIPGSFEALRRIWDDKSIADLNLVADIAAGKRTGIDYRKRHSSTQISKHVDFAAIAQGPFKDKLHLAVTDETMMQGRLFQPKDFDDPIEMLKVMRASSSFPVIFGNEPVKINGESYWDGDLGFDWKRTIEEYGLTDVVVSLPQPVGRPVKVDDFPRMFPKKRAQFQKADFLNELRYLENLAHISALAKSGTRVYVHAPKKELLVESTNPEHRGRMLYYLYRHMLNNTRDLLSEREVKR